MQETKLADADAPSEEFAQAGYELAHHGEGRWNGVAIASRVGLADVIDELRRAAAPRRATPDVGDDEPLAEARMISAVCGGVRVVEHLRAERPQRGLALLPGEARVVRAPRALARARRVDPASRSCSAATSTSRPTDADVWDPQACHGGTHVSAPERAAFAGLCAWGLVDAYRVAALRSRIATPGGTTARATFHKNFGMRIDHLLVTAPARGRVVWAEIDREARKGKPTPVRPRAAPHRPRRARPRLRRRLDLHRKKGRVALGRRSGPWVGVEEPVPSNRRRP